MTELTYETRHLFDWLTAELTLRARHFLGDHRQCKDPRDCPVGADLRLGLGVYEATVESLGWEPQQIDDHVIFNYEVDIEEYDRVMTKTSLDLKLWLRSHMCSTRGNKAALQERAREWFISNPKATIVIQPVSVAF